MFANIFLDFFLSFLNNFAQYIRKQTYTNLEKAFPVDVEYMTPKQVLQIE